MPMVRSSSARPIVVRLEGGASLAQPAEEIGEPPMDDAVAVAIIDGVAREQEDKNREGRTNFAAYTCP